MRNAVQQAILENEVAHGGLIVELPRRDIEVLRNAVTLLSQQHNDRGDGFTAAEVGLEIDKFEIMLNRGPDGVLRRERGRGVDYRLDLNHISPVTLVEALESYRSHANGDGNRVETLIKRFEPFAESAERLSGAEWANLTYRSTGRG